MNTDFRADLHCHSTCSDGTFTPSHLIQHAFQNSLKGLSITDHDTIDAYEEALPMAQAKNVLLIPGVEFSAIHRDINVHMLAYSFSINAPSLVEFCKRHYKRRIERVHLFLEKLASAHMPLTFEEILSKAPLHSIGRPHIAMAMVKRGYVSSIHQAFFQYIGENKPCYVSSESYSVEETLEVIHQSKGLAVIAHPHLIQNVAVLKDLLEFNFDGIEGYYGRFQASMHERWLKIGARKDWIITGGSDFHGDVKPNISIGSSWTNKETFMTLYRHFQNNQNTCLTQT